jgi:K+-transporting ATPase KdpF subunit
LPAKKSEVIQMIYLTGVISALLFAYLLAALIRPEWF